MDQARSVEAQFTNTSPTPTMRTLTVVKSGGGSGTVTSTPAGINCGSDCSASFTDGTSLTLTATRASGSTFAGWEGEGCSGTATCIVTMNQVRQVTATFGLQAPTPSSPPADESSPTPALNPSLPSEPDFEPETVDDSPPVAAIASDRLRMSQRGYVRVRISCSDSPEDCLGVVRLRLRFPADATAAALRTVGRASFEIAAGETKRVKLRLRRGARRLVRHERRVRVRVVAVVHDGAGNERTLRKRLTLRAAR